jgi:hypothetical protein
MMSERAAPLVPKSTVYAERGPGVEDNPSSKYDSPDILASLRRQMSIEYEDAAMLPMGTHVAVWET